MSHTLSARCTPPGAARFLSLRLTPLLLLLLLLAPLVLLLSAACNVNRGEDNIPADAQARIDTVTADIDEGRDEKIYSEAAEEWRRNSTPEQSRAIFEHLRSRLGKAKERARQTAHEEQKATNGALAHTIVVRYETKFERGNGMETFTLVQRGGDWLLAGYFVNSDALK